MAYYFDSSALVKLVLDEPESLALARWLGSQSGPVISSDLTRTELLRAARRVDATAVVDARAVLARTMLLTVPTATYEAAGLLEPRHLRSLDAIHLTAALSLGDRLEGVVTYDERLAEAARAHGITVLAPA